MIKNIVFDMGNVVLTYNPNEIIKHFTLDEHEQEVLIETVFNSQEWLELDKGEITKEDAVNKIKKRVPNKLHLFVDKVMDEWYQYLPENKEISILVKGLRERGYRIYLLSNAALCFYDYYQKVTAFKYFNGFYVSAKHHLLKPDPKIYEDFFHSFRLEAKECFFIDDNIDNVNGSIDCGMDAVVFTGNVEQLINVMKEKKIL